MATGDGWMNKRLNLPCVSVPIIVLTILVVVGFALFASGTIFTGIGYSKKKTVDDIRGTKFMRELGPALIAIGLLTTLLCAFAIFAARRMFSKVPSRAQANQSATNQTRSTRPISAVIRQTSEVYQNTSESISEWPRPPYNRSYSNEPLEPIRPPRPSRRPLQPTAPASHYDSAIRPINATLRQNSAIYESTSPNISEWPRYNRSYSNEPLEPIRPPRPSRRPRQPTPLEVRTDEEVNEVPPSYDEVMSQVLHAQTL